MIEGKKLTTKIFSVNALAYLLIAVFIAYFAYLSFGRHDSLKTFMNDLGTYDQIVWNNLHGNLFQISAGIYSTSESTSYLSGHFSPILLLLAPFYLVWTSAKMLLLLQAIAVGIGGLPVYWLAREKIKNKSAGIVFLASYLLYPILHNALLYDFHEITLAVPFVSFALYFMLKKRYGWMALFLILIGVSQEHLALIAAMIGLYIIFIQKNKKIGGIIFITALAYFAVVLFAVMPVFSATHGLDVIKSPAGVTTRYSWLGSSAGEIAKTVVTKPFWLVSNLASRERINFITIILIPLIGLPLFSSLTLICLPVLLLYFLSSYMMTYSIYFYHSSVLTAVFYFGAILSFSRLFREIKWQRLFLIILLVSSVALSYIHSVSPFGKNGFWQEYRPSKNARLLKDVKALIPSNAVLSVQHNIGSHFTERRGIYRFPLYLDRADYVIVDVFNPFTADTKSIFGMEDVNQMEYESWKRSIERMLISSQFGIIYSNSGWLVFKRGADQSLNTRAINDYLIALDIAESYGFKK